MLTPLHWAAERGHLDIFQLIFEAVENKNPRDIFGNTPFHLAALKNHSEKCNSETLFFTFANSMDINPANARGFTPLHFAACMGHVDICKLILENTPDKNPISITGMTPKDLATKNNHAEVFELFQQ